MRWIIVAILISILAIAAGCGGRVVYVSDGTPVRLRETVKGVKVWVRLTTGEIVPETMDLPEGWYCLPMLED